MLEMLLSHPRQVISAEQFMSHIWGYDSQTDSSVVAVNVSYLRKKLSSLQANVEIKVKRNLGYSLEEAP
jgi:DNA-binding response OmpR family regulator